MAVPKKLELRGAVTSGPVTPTSSPFPTGESIVSLNVDQTPQADVAKAFSVNSPSSFQDILTGTGITNLTFISLRVRSGTFQVRRTSAGGADQIDTLSELLVVSNPTSGSEWTALAVQGVGDIEMLLAGT
jgi:hypothetical protein